MWIDMDDVANLCGQFNPDFSDPVYFAELTGKLFKDKMWKAFVYYNHNLNNSCTQLDWADYVAYLFSDPSRFRDLFTEFLCLPETIERWGWEPCFDGDSTTCYEKGCESWVGNCPGKFLTPWARYAKETE